MEELVQMASTTLHAHANLDILARIALKRSMSVTQTHVSMEVSVRMETIRSHAFVCQGSLAKFVKFFQVAK